MVEYSCLFLWLCYFNGKFNNLLILIAFKYCRNIFSNTKHFNMFVFLSLSSAFVFLSLSSAMTIIFVVQSLCSICPISWPDTWRGEISCLHFLSWKHCSFVADPYIPIFSCFIYLSILILALNTFSPILSELMWIEEIYVDNCVLRNYWIVVGWLVLFVSPISICGLPKEDNKLDQCQVLLVWGSLILHSHIVPFI